MALRSGHGAGAGSPRIEVLPVDELPRGIPADALVESPSDRGAHGAFAPGNKIGARGGAGKRGKTRLAHQVSLTGAPALDPLFESYRRAAVSFRKAQCSELAANVGGGFLGPGPSSLVASAAMQLAMSRFLSDTADGDGKLMMQASRLANDSRQNLLAAHELAAKEALARKAKATGATLPSWMQGDDEEEPGGGESPAEEDEG